MTAPLQVIALSFSRGAGSEDRILAEVDRLRGREFFGCSTCFSSAKAKTEPSNG